MMNLLLRNLLRYLTLALLPAVLIAGTGNAMQHQHQVPDPTPLPPGGDFTLQSVAGPVRLQDFRGKVVLIYFGYTRCPDICATSMAFINQALNALSPEELQRVRALFITVDPQRDTPERLAAFVRPYHPNVIGLTGRQAEIADVAARYGVKYYAVDSDLPGSDRIIDHSSALYLITPDGKLSRTLSHGTPPSAIVGALRTALAAGEQP